MKSRLLLAAAAMALGFIPSLAAAQDTGFGDDIPLELAIRQIVPAGMTVKLDDGVNGKAHVTWSSQSGWKKALDQAVGGAGYVAVVSDTTVEISRAGATVEAMPATVKAPPSKAAVFTGSKPSSPRPPRYPAPQEPSVAAMPVVSGGGFVLITNDGHDGGDKDGGWVQYPATGGNWVVQTGDDLRGTLLAWAERAGWRVVWQSDYSYKLTSAAKFSGDFVNASTELLRAMQDARPVVTAQFYQGNKVLVVGNNNLDEVN